MKLELLNTAESTLSELENLIRNVMTTDTVSDESTMKEIKRLAKECGLNQRELNELINKYNNSNYENDLLEIIAESYSKPKKQEEQPKKSIKISVYNLAVYFERTQKYKFLIGSGGEISMIYFYNHGYYKGISEKTLKGYIKEICENALDKYAELSDENAVCVTEYRNSHLIYASILKSAFEQIVCSTTHNVSVSELNANETLINFQNGIVDFSESDAPLRYHNSNILSTIQLPCNYIPNCTDTAPVFEKYLNDLTDGDNEKKRVILEYMAVAVSNICGHRFKKAMFFIGQGDTGKSKIRNLLEYLIGESHCSSADLNKLEERFGASAVYNKRVVGSMDMGFINVKELRMFKLVTGGDEIPIEYKGKDGFDYIFKGLLLFGANQLPKFGGDKGKWVYDRMIIIRCNNVIPKEKQDATLLDKMKAESEIIVNAYLLPVLKEMLRNGLGALRYTIPQSSIDEIEQYKITNNSVLQFLKECTTEENVPKKAHLTMKQLYTAYKEWAKDNTRNAYSVDKTTFTEEICNKYNVSHKSEIEQAYNGKYLVRLFTLTQDAREELHIFNKTE